MARGILYGVGVGPGDPELITVKAINAIGSGDVIAVPDSGGREEAALSIAKAYIKGKPVIRLEMPMTRDKALRKSSHRIAADRITELLDEGESVAFLTLGDPTVYSTYMYLHELVTQKGYEAKIIPGVPSFCAAAAAAGEALCKDDELLHIIPASYRERYAEAGLNGNRVFMKAGKGIKEVYGSLDAKNELENAVLVERCGMEEERILRGTEMLEGSGGYFSIILVRGGNV